MFNDDDVDLSNLLDPRFDSDSSSEDDQQNSNKRKKEVNTLTDCHDTSVRIKLPQKVLYEFGPDYQKEIIQQFWSCNVERRKQWI